MNTTKELIATLLIILVLASSVPIIILLGCYFHAYECYSLPFI